MHTDIQYLKAPFPWFGGKSRAGRLVWERLGAVPNYIEPFAGSLAVLLARPTPTGTETVNDRDAMIANAWRAIQGDPQSTATWARNPINEADLHARHLWLSTQRATMTARIMGDPHYYDTKIAGWWLWGINLWIGRGWCAASEPGGISRLPTLRRPRAMITAIKQPERLLSWFTTIEKRLQHVEVCCGDWARVLSPAITYHRGLTGVLLDPPYGGEANRTAGLYAHDTSTIASDVRTWCVKNGPNPLLRIALGGYQGEHEALEQEGWTVSRWKAAGGYSNQGRGRGRENAHRETIWFSPYCLRQHQLDIFAG